MTYKKFIEAAQKKTYRKKGGKRYYELHHILPRFMGGTDDVKNFVLLNVKEHCQQHYMLALENKSNQKVYWGNLCSAVMICKPFTYDKCDTEEKKIKAIERFLNYGDIKKITEQRKELAEKRILAEMSRNSAKQPGKCPVCKKKLKQGEVACCA